MSKNYIYDVRAFNLLARDYVSATDETKAEDKAYNVFNLTLDLNDGDFIQVKKVICDRCDEYANTQYGDDFICDECYKLEIEVDEVENNEN